MRHPFATELTRSIKTTLTRFLAIMGIVGLGVGFYAGLRMVGQDMRLAADTYYDGTRLYDMRVVSTLGLEEAQVETIRELEDVEEAVGAYATDVVANMGGDRYCTRIISFDVEAAKASKSNEIGTVVSSKDDAYLNRIVLTEGKWPESVNECVISADCVLSDPIKPGDTIEVLYGSGSLDEVLTTMEFTVSGLVRSSSFPSNVNLGYTNLASGLLKDFIYVMPEAFSDELPYTEVYVTAKGARDLESGTDEYQARIDKVAEEIEGLGLGTLRYLQIKTDAEAQIAEAEAEYDEGSAEAEQELGDAEGELDAALKKLQSAESEIKNGEAELQAGIEELAAARATAQRRLASARATLEANERKLNDGEKQLGMSQSDINNARSQVDSAAAQWSSQRAELSSAKSDLLSARSSLVEVRNAASSGGDPTAEDVANLASKLSGAISTLQNLNGSDYGDGIASDLIGELDGIDLSGDPEEAYARNKDRIPGIANRGIGEIDSAVSKIDSGIAQGDSEVASARSQVNQAQDARNQLDSGWAQLKQGWNTYYAQEAQANQQLASAQATIDESAAKLAAAKSQLAAGKAEYENGLAAYNSARAEVDSRLSDASAQLAAARGNIDEIGEPDVFVLDRTTNMGVASHLSDANRIDSISTVFPFIFFLVAALVSLTTMTRMVEDERVDIGTHKALGFSTARITAKYIAYASIAAILGGIIGIAVLTQLIPYVLQTAYGIMYEIPLLPLPFPIDAVKALAAIGLGLGVIILAIFGAAAATLREVPASLMLPRAPKAGKRILLEHITPLWSKLSFSWKVTFRNIFRYRQRLIMTVVGVAGCTALLLTGFGLHDAIWDILGLQFEGDAPIVRYNVIVGMYSDVDAEDLASAEEKLTEEAKAEGFAQIDVENMQVSSDTYDGTNTIQAYVVNDYEPFTSMVTLRDRVSKNTISFDANSVVITEKIANMMGVGAGDTVTIYDQDMIGNPVGDGYPLKITAVTENYAMNYLYVGEDAWKAATEKEYKPSAILLRAGTSQKAHDAIEQIVSDSKSLASASFLKDSIDGYRTSLQSVNMIVVVLVAAAALLAFIVLYNLTNIQLIERTREIASLKVLGFNRREVSNYLFRETLILVVVGALVGLAAGTVMANFVIQTAETDAAMFGREIHTISYLYSFGLTILFSLVVMAAVSPKLHSIDMVESLKSVD